MTEKKEFRNFGTINFAPHDSEAKKALRNCNKLRHPKREENIGRCFNRYTCDICGFSYEVDSSD